MPPRYCCPLCPKNHDRHSPSHLRDHFERVHHLDLPRRPIGARVARSSPSDNNNLGCCSCIQTFPTLDVFRNHLVVDYGVELPDAPDVQWSQQQFQMTFPEDMRSQMSYVTPSKSTDSSSTTTE
ncbi:hypothetical protein BC940DRAFT_329830 [Gongronella butleri]|nr:hypothetical protein BC940DRAFT_329830 [Gongronella butleri]